MFTQSADVGTVWQLRIWSEGVRVAEKSLGSSTIIPILLLVISILVTIIQV